MWVLQHSTFVSFIFRAGDNRHSDHSVLHSTPISTVHSKHKTGNKQKRWKEDAVIRDARPCLEVSISIPNRAWGKRSLRSAQGLFRYHLQSRDEIICLMTPLTRRKWRKWLRRLLFIAENKRRCRWLIAAEFAWRCVAQRKKSWRWASSHLSQTCKSQATWASALTMGLLNTCFGSEKLEHH